MQFDLNAVIPAPPEAVYRAWLDSDGHTKMTGSPATASAEVGGTFVAWDGYITGSNVALDPGKRIVQAWRTRDFAAEEPDSEIEVLLAPTEGGTQLTLHHAKLPPHGAQYETGWPEHYFEPMRAYFGGAK